MRITLLINCPSFSINSYYYYPVLNSDIAAYNSKKRKRIYAKPVRSADARNWARSVFTELNKPYNLQKMKEFREHFDEKTMSIGIEIGVYYPKLYTKCGKIHKYTYDCSNFEKPLIDLIFDKKFFKRPAPEGCKNLNVDDRFITELVSKKLQSDTDRDYMTVTLYTKDNEDTKNPGVTFENTENPESTENITKINDASNTKDNNDEQKVQED